MVVPANSPIKNAKDLAEAVKKDVAKVTFAGGSAGGVDHIMAALFVGAAGADASKVNYVAFSGGGESLAAILGGKVTAGISGYGEYEGQIKAGKLRAIGVTSPQRLPGVDVPTFKEQGIDLVLTNWRSVFGAPGITDAQKKALGELVEKLVKSAAWKDILKQKGWDDAYLPGDAVRQVPGGRADPRQQRAEDGGVGEVAGRCIARHRRAAPCRERPCEVRSPGKPGVTLRLREAHVDAARQRPDTAGMVIAGVLLLIAAVIFWDTSALQLAHDLRRRAEGDALRHRRPAWPLLAAGNFCAGVARRFPRAREASIRRRSSSSSAASPR